MEELNYYLALSYISIPLWAKVQILKKVSFLPSYLFGKWKENLYEFNKWKDVFLNFNEWKKLDEIVKDCSSRNIKILLPCDKEYPRLLLETPDFPVVLFCVGDVNIINSSCFSIVGTRAMSHYGSSVIKRLVPDLCRAGFCIVSGMARGVDGCAHFETLNNAGRTIAVLGTGVDTPFPYQNRTLYQKILNSGGLIISEFMPGEPGFKQNFPRRNRIIAGLSHGTLVIEAGLDSGSLITSSIAATYSRDVFAVPGSILSKNADGTNALIKKGAIVVCSSDDILEHYELLIKDNMSKTVKKQVSDTAKSLLVILNGQGCDVNQLLQESGLSSGELFKNLEELQLNGYISIDEFGAYHLT